MPGANEKRHAPATIRNREPILRVLERVLPASGLVLEVASGSGEHAMHFARGLPALEWQPTDSSRDALRSIGAWHASEGPANLLAPLALDAADADWPVVRADAVACINMIHISPWEATEGLMRGAGRVLASGAPLYLYGPFRRTGRLLEPSNDAFDHDLRSRDSRWGLRSLDKVVTAAARHALIDPEVIEMPANNLSVIFRKR